MISNIFGFLRGLSALLIILWHNYWIYQMSVPAFKPPFILLGAAWVGIFVFFILSGYLIGKGFYNEKYKTDSFKDFLKFYIQRALRILPIYYFIVFIDIFFVNTGMYFGSSNHFLRDVLLMSFHESNGMVGNMWFICTCVKFYLFAPIFHLAVIKPVSKLKYKKIIFISLIIALILGEFYFRSTSLGHIHWGYKIYKAWQGNIDLFFSGFLLNYILTNKDFSILKQRLKPFIMALFLGFVLWQNYCMGLHWKFDIGAEELKVYAPFITIILMTLIIYAYDMKKPENNNAPLSKLSFLNPAKWLEGLGVISMGFFVSHCQTISKLIGAIHISEYSRFSFNIFGLLNKPIAITLSPYCKTFYSISILAITASIIWGGVIYYLLEKPINNYRKNLITDKNERIKND